MTIDHARWQRVSPLLDQALDLAPEDRGPWLEGLRRDDAKLAGEVELLGAKALVYEIRRPA